MSVGKIGVVDVGGGFRGVYAAGVLDYCMDNGIRFDLGIGVSAGSANLISYCAGQRGRNYHFYVEYGMRKEYASVGNFLRKRSFVDMDYVYGTLSNSDGENPLDYAAAMPAPWSISPWPPRRRRERLSISTRATWPRMTTASARPPAPSPSCAIPTRWAGRSTMTGRCRTLCRSESVRVGLRAGRAAAHPSRGYDPHAGKGRKACPPHPAQIPAGGPGPDPTGGAV